MNFINLFFTVIFKNSAVAGRISLAPNLFMRENRPVSWFKIYKNSLTKLTVCEFLILNYFVALLLLTSQTWKIIPTQKQIP